MATERTLHRVRLEWADDSRFQVTVVTDPEGPFILEPEFAHCLKWQPKTEHEKLVEAANRGEIPTATSPEIESQWSSWSRGFRIPGGGISFGGEFYRPPQIDILDYWSTDDGNHSCPKRVVVEGVLYNIPKPPEPPKEEEFEVVPLLE